MIGSLDLISLYADRPTSRQREDTEEVPFHYVGGSVMKSGHRLCLIMSSSLVLCGNSRFRTPFQFQLVIDFHQCSSAGCQ